MIAHQRRLDRHSGDRKGGNDGNVGRQLFNIAWEIRQGTVWRTRTSGSHILRQQEDFEKAIEYHT
jgi:hypothetical protein